MMSKIPKVGVIPLSSPDFESIAERYMSILCENLRRRKIDVISPGRVVLGPEDFIKSLNFTRSVKVDCVVILVASMIDKDIASVISQHLHNNLPLLIWSIRMPASLSLAGALLLKSFASTYGLKHKLIYGDPNEQRLLSQASAFIRASKAFMMLKGLRIGIIGGLRFLLPHQMDLSLLDSFLKAEFVWIDEHEVIDRAEDVKEDEIRLVINQLKEAGYQLKAPSFSLTPSVRIYHALKELIKIYKLNAMLINCGSNLRKYATGCLAVSLLQEEGIPVDCLSDIHGLLGVCLAFFLSNSPVFSGFLSDMDFHDKIVCITNCGAIPPRLAYDPRDVLIVPQSQRLGKGVSLSLVTKRSRVTVLRVSHDNSKFRLLIASGELFPVPRERLQESERAWPRVFIKLDGNPQRLLGVLKSPRVSMVLGDHRRSLSELASLLDFELTII